MDPMPEEELARPRDAFPRRAWIAGGCAGLLLALFALTWIVPRVLQMFTLNSTGKAMVDLILLEEGLRDFSLANEGRYPDALEALVVPDANSGHTYFKGPKIPLDPWGNKYLYDPSGPDRSRPRVYTLGRDGAPGGEGDDRDIDNLSISARKAH